MNVYCSIQFGGMFNFTAQRFEKKHYFTRNKETIQMGRQLNLIKLEYY